MYHSVSPLIFILAGTALAIPSALEIDPRQLGCNTNTEFQNLVQSKPYDLPPVMAPGRCQSIGTEGCNIENSVSHTVSVEKSISVGGSLDVAKTFGAGIDAGFSYTWGTSDETGTATQVVCPKGGIECGVMVTAKVVKIAGQTRELWFGGSCEPPYGDWYDFEIVAPFKEGNGPTDAMKALMVFEPCVISCNSERFPDSCDIAYQEAKMQACPSQLVVPCEGSFGGTCGKA